MTSNGDDVEARHESTADNGIPRTIATSGTSSTSDIRTFVDPNEEVAYRAGDHASEKTTERQPESSTRIVSTSMVLSDNEQMQSECSNEAMEPSAEETRSVVSMPAVPTRNEVANEPMVSYSDASTVISAPAVVVPTESDDMDGMDEYIRSPQGQNAIVEHSPGGRYVRFMEKLGSGASKEVYRAYDTQEGIEVAWNVVNLSGVPKTERNRIVNEVRLLERLHHNNIISFHGSWVNRERQEVNFVTEILSSGNLKTFINKVKVIRWKIAKRWALQILKGLQYLHSQDPPVIHRDLKCENIFINGTSGDLRIGDLGLSTVHRNDGKVLSVLGTPEFMAPDMYEEVCYDEKVDIYAFGMCLLEIFTKEIPYQECSNPAQIYRKVTQGNPPESLSRLKSRHAREFIELCLGYKNESGNYVRPTAEELISHDFLLKRPNDDDEVEVDPPLQERTIREVSTESSSPGLKNGAPSSKTKKRVDSTAGTSRTTSGETSSDETSPREKEGRSDSRDDESDRFDEMPDSEVNIRKVKVMIGRGQELNDDEETSAKADKLLVTESDHGNEVTSTEFVQAAATAPLVDVDSTSGNVGVATETNTGNAAQNQSTLLNYLVAAAVIENQPAESRLYADDILKLVVTLPVEGQTQNVQFDFHLIEDDPVQVAKEMVAELCIPQAAVLEISETISGLACAARMKQDKNLGRVQNNQGHMIAQSQGMIGQHQQVTNHGAPQGISQEIPPGMVIQQPAINQHGVQNQNIMHSATHQSIPEYVNTQQMVSSDPQTIQQGMAAVQEPSGQMHTHSMGQQSSAQTVQIQAQNLSLQGNDFQGMKSEGQGQNGPTMYGHSGIHTNSQLQPQHVMQQGGNDYEGSADAPLANPTSYGQPSGSMQMNSQQQSNQSTILEFSGKHSSTQLQQPSTPQSFGLPSHIQSQQQESVSHMQGDYHSHSGSSEMQSQPVAHGLTQHMQIPTNGTEYQNHVSSCDMQSQASGSAPYIHSSSSQVSMQSKAGVEQPSADGRSQALHYGHSTLQGHVAVMSQPGEDYQGKSSETQPQYSSAQFVHGLGQMTSSIVQPPIPAMLSQNSSVQQQMQQLSGPRQDLKISKENVTQSQLPNSQTTHSHHQQQTQQQSNQLFHDQERHQIAELQQQQSADKGLEQEEQRQQQQRMQHEQEQKPQILQQQQSQLRLQAPEQLQPQQSQQHEQQALNLQQNDQHTQQLLGMERQEQPPTEQQELPQLQQIQPKELDEFRPHRQQHEQQLPNNPPDQKESDAQTHQHYLVKQQQVLAQPQQRLDEQMQEVPHQLSVGSGHQANSIQISQQQQIVSAATKQNESSPSDGIDGQISQFLESTFAANQMFSSNALGSTNASGSEVFSPHESSSRFVDVPSAEYLDELDAGQMHAELRKLDEDFHRNIQRAMKVFDNRMDNLQRTQHQREAQHQKTLERHQKERADFEKRLQQEEIEQNRRMEQLRKEWDRRRDAVRQKTAADSAPDTKVLGVNPGGEGSTMPRSNLNGSVGSEPDR